MRDTFIHLCSKVKRFGLTSVIKSIALFALFVSILINLSCEKGRETESKSKTNSPPVITSVSLLPNKPNKESDLSTVIQSQDPDGDLIIYRYQWIKNDEEIIGEEKNTLNRKNFKKRDLIQVRVIPSDGKVNGKPFLSTPIRIFNSQPLIEEVRIEPKVAYVNSPLKVRIKSADKDGDFIYYTYQWEKNGEVMAEDRGEELEQGRFKRGDSITVTVNSDDRESQSPSKKSNPIIISNNPPVITSSPPTSIDGMTYIYQVKVNDPDHDPIIFTLKSGPKGMEIDKDTGLLRWAIQKDDREPHMIEIEASDNAGAKSLQRYTLTVEYK